MSTLLKDIPREELPRERLLTYGKEALSNEELLSIILRTGTKGESVKTLSSNILKSCSSIQDLKNFTINKLKTIKGLGSVKSITLLASLELGRRVYETSDTYNNTKINCSLDIYRYFAKYITEEKQENFLVVYLDTKSKCISHKILFKGTINMSIVHPREVFKTALLENASAVVLLHNHPSGDTTPSEADNEVTKNMIEVGNIMGIKVLDHLIVSRNDYYSYLEEGKITHE